MVAKGDEKRSAARRQRSAGGANGRAGSKTKRKRARKRHEQLGLLSQDGTRAKPTRGGRRRGAGRKPKGKRAGAAHRKRPEFKPSIVLHVILRLTPAIGRLRVEAVYEAIREATHVVSRRPDMRIVHMSIQDSHVHMIVEADGRTALAKGMQAFQISAAKRINRAISKPGESRRTGCVFQDRYHVEYLETPTQVRNAINYVLNNWRHHGADHGLESASWKVDPFSSGATFEGWQERERRGPFQLPGDYRPLVMRRPQTWLLAVGWRRCKVPISYHAVPGPVFGRPTSGRKSPRGAQQRARSTPAAGS